MAKSKKVNSVDSLQVLVRATLTIGACYIAVSWAIDSGSMLSYALSFVLIYYSVRFTKQFVKVQFNNNEKKSKAPRATKKNTNR